MRDERSVGGVYGDRNDGGQSDEGRALVMNHGRKGKPKICRLGVDDAGRRRGGGL